jgi:hypothetical protein
VNDLADITILCSGHGEHVVRAGATPTPALVVHEDAHRPGRWTVTHAPSGTALTGPLGDPETALHVAVQLGTCGDWDRPGSVIRNDHAMHARWRAVLGSQRLLTATLKRPSAPVSAIRAHEAKAA